MSIAAGYRKKTGQTGWRIRLTERRVTPLPNGSIAFQSQTVEETGGNAHRIRQIGWRIFLTKVLCEISDPSGTPAFHRAVGF